MIQLPEDRRPPLTPQLALRVAAIGTFALAMFAIIFFRLWFLQVLSGDKYLAQASVNRVRDIGIPAPRGQIIDRSGNILVDSRPTIAVQLSPPDLPRNPRRRQRLFNHLAVVLGTSTNRQRCPVAGHGVEHLAPIQCSVAQQQALLPYANVTVKTDVSKYVHYYLAERQDQFPGVNVEQVYLRSYPLHSLAAQLFGTVGPINSSEIHQRRYRGVSQNSIVGQSGLEWYYDRYLRGADGADRVQVDALGRFKGYLRRSKPVAGHTPEALARRQPPARGTAGAPAGDQLQSARGRRRVRGDEPRERRGLRAGLASHVRPEHLHQAGLGDHLPAAQQPLQRLPAAQPRDPERVSDRIDVQADHGYGRAAERGLEPQRHLRRRWPVLHRHASAGTTRGTPPTGSSTSSTRSGFPPTTSSTTSAR